PAGMLAASGAAAPGPAGVWPMITFMGSSFLAFALQHRCYIRGAWQAPGGAAADHAAPRGRRPDGLAARPGQSGEPKQGQGSALKPARGPCPLDPHQRRSLWDPSILFGGEGGGLGPVWAAAIAPAFASAMAAAQTGLGPPSRAPNK